MSVELTFVWRGELIESIHRGDVVVVNSKGKILAYAGDPFKVTYIRSSAKPIQAINVFLSGAYEKFNFSDDEISIMCASHFGEDFHIKTVKNILNKIGASEKDLLCGGGYSINREYALKQARENITITPLHSDCSGKHAGIIASCIAKGYGIKDYNKPNHPVQRDILEIISKMCEIDEDKIILGIDGCTVPVFGMPIYNLALAFAKLSNPKDLEDDIKFASENIFRAMNTFPEMVAGTGGFCTELMKNTKGKLIEKLGAEAVYAVGVKDLDIGIAVKIEDGNFSRALYPVVVEVLERLKVLDEDEKEKLKKFKIIDNKNSVGDIVGVIKPVFTLKYL